MIAPAQGDPHDRRAPEREHHLLVRGGVPVPRVGELLPNVREPERQEALRRVDLRESLRRDRDELVQAVEALVGLEDAAAPIREDALGTGRRLDLVLALDEVLVPRTAERIVSVDRHGLRRLAVVVDHVSEVRRHAVGHVADVDVEALVEAFDHASQVRHHQAQLRHQRAELLLAALASVHRPHQVEVELRDAVGREERGEAIDRRVVRADDAHVDRDPLTPGR